MFSLSRVGVRCSSYLVARRMNRRNRKMKAWCEAFVKKHEMTPEEWLEKWRRDELSDNFENNVLAQEVGIYVRSPYGQALKDASR